MSENIHVEFADGFHSLKIDPPTKCPHCGETVYPQIVGQSKSPDKIEDFSITDEPAVFSILFRCPFHECRRFFAAEYLYDEDSGARYLEYAYRPKIEVDLPKNIDKVSPIFDQIFRQSTIAESENLDLVAGVGYRKSAEFLIKDYAIRKSPSDELKIKGMPLGQVIKKYLKDFPKIQDLSKAIAWVGNDETHYLRRHKDKDLHDLKQFIDAAARFIAADYVADQARSFTSLDS